MCDSSSSCSAALRRGTSVTTSEPTGAPLALGFGTLYPRESASDAGTPLGALTPDARIAKAMGEFTASNLAAMDVRYLPVQLEHDALGAKVGVALGSEVQDGDLRVAVLGDARYVRPGAGLSLSHHALCQDLDNGQVRVLKMPGEFSVTEDPKRPRCFIDRVIVPSASAITPATRPPHRHDASMSAPEPAVPTAPADAAAAAASPAEPALPAVAALTEEDMRTNPERIAPFMLDLGRQLREAEARHEQRDATEKELRERLKAFEDADEVHKAAMLTEIKKDFKSLMPAEEDEDKRMEMDQQVEEAASGITANFPQLQRLFSTLVAANTARAARTDDLETQIEQFRQGKTFATGRYTARGGVPASAPPPKPPGEPQKRSADAAALDRPLLDEDKNPAAKAVNRYIGAADSSADGPALALELLRSRFG
jgi:hypothetical protein